MKLKNRVDEARRKGKAKPRDEPNILCQTCKYIESWDVDEGGVVWGSDVECETCWRFQVGMGDHYEKKGG